MHDGKLTRLTGGPRVCALYVKFKLREQIQCGHALASRVWPVEGGLRAVRGAFLAESWGGSCRRRLAANELIVLPSRSPSLHHRNASWLEGGHGRCGLKMTNKQTSPRASLARVTREGVSDAHLYYSCAYPRNTYEIGAATLLWNELLYTGFSLCLLRPSEVGAGLSDRQQLGEQNHAGPVLLITCSVTPLSLPGSRAIWQGSQHSRDAPVLRCPHAVVVFRSRRESQPNVVVGVAKVAISSEAAGMHDFVGRDPPRPCSGALPYRAIDTW